MTDVFTIGNKCVIKAGTVRGAGISVYRTDHVQEAMDTLRSHALLSNSSDVMYAYETRDGRGSSEDEMGRKLLVSLSRQDVEQLLVAVFVWSELPVSAIPELPSVALKILREICVSHPRIYRAKTPHPRLHVSTELSTSLTPLRSFRSPKVITSPLNQVCTDAETTQKRTLKDIKAIRPQRFLLLCNNSGFYNCLQAAEIVTGVALSEKNLWKRLSDVRPEQLTFAQVREIKALFVKLPMTLVPEAKLLFDFIHSLLALRQQRQNMFPLITCKNNPIRKFDAFLRRKEALRTQRKDSKSVEPTTNKEGNKEKSSGTGEDRPPEGNLGALLNVPRPDIDPISTTKDTTVPHTSLLVAPEVESKVAEARRLEAEMNGRIEKLIRLRFEEIDTQEVNIDSFSDKDIEQFLATTVLDDLPYNVLLALISRFKQGRRKVLGKAFGKGKKK